MIKKAIIPAAGLGTRLLPATKEQPKEMLPILIEDVNDILYLKPFLQVVFEQLYDADFREICFVVGRGKRSIEDHFTVDNNFVDYLKLKNKIGHLNALITFYEKVRNSIIAFASQPQPLGFADAVYCARFFSGDEDFVVHAGDDLILSRENCMRRLVSVFGDYRADAAFFVQRVKDPTKYGVVTGEKMANGVYHVKRVIEKPSKPQSRLAVVAIYAFKPVIYQAIEQVKPDINNEIQLTDAIQVLINQRDAVYALELRPDEKRIEIGDPASYRNAFTAKIVQPRQLEVER